MIYVIYFVIDADAKTKIENVFCDYKPVLYRIAYSILHNTHDAEDAVQETFFKLLKSNEQIPTNDRIRAYSIVVTKHVCAKISQKSGHTVCIDDIADYLSDQSTSPEEIALEHDDIYRLVDTICGLPEKYAHPMLMYYDLGLSYSEIAHALGITAATARKRVSNGRKYLFRQMERGDLKHA